MKEERKISGSEGAAVTQKWKRRFGNVECGGRQGPKSSSKIGDKTDVSCGKEIIFWVEQVFNLLSQMNGY